MRSTKRDVLSGLLVVVVSLAASGWAQDASEPRQKNAVPAVSFVGKSLPVPPQQAEPWAPPKSKLPEPLLTATEFLFAHGAADPRGCEYRELTVVTGAVWGGHSAVKTHGWVLPEAAAREGRFAVCWNGLVYPVTEVGPLANLSADVELPAAKGWLGNAIPEGNAVNHRSTLPLRACLLLRLGEVELAEKSWKVPASTTRSGKAAADDPFVILSTDWLWMSFDRALCAHMRGDHRLALVTAEPIAKHREAFEREAERRGFAKPDDLNSNERKQKPYFSFLIPLDRLLAEQKRRVQLEPVVRVLGADKGAFADQEPRIAALVRDLEEVAARQWGQPGGVSLAGDPIVAALAKEGTVTIDTLLKCLEQDQRLTRSVSFHRDFFTHRNLIGVDEAAYAALCLILETQKFGPRTEHGYDHATGDTRRAVAEEIRQYWEERRKVPIEERWFLTLKDDNATSSQWLEAASRITMASDVRVEGAWTVTSARKDGKVPPMRGEPLREKTEPSVSELLAKRSDQIAASNDPSSRILFELKKAAQVAQCLAKWDERAALPTLKARARDCAKMTSKTSAFQGNAMQILGESLATLTITAARAGDTELFPDYCRWLRETPPGKLIEASSFRTHDLFAPLWLGAENETCRETAEVLFNGTNSDWNPVHRVQPNGRPFQPERLAATPLLGVAPFREQLLRNLGDKAAVGTVSVKNGSVSLQQPGRSGGVAITNRTDPHLPKTDAAQNVRECDLYAWHLSSVDGAPLFELYWPEEVRDQTLAHCREFVTRWGSRYGTSVPRNDPSRRGRDFQMTYAHFTLPPLKRPATEEDLKQGVAIFSLGTVNPVRQVLLEPFPRPARWVTLKDFPVTELTADPNGEPKVSHQQAGFVWQAEEVQQDGQWVRYYGFVGRHSIARVPAAEIEFPVESKPERP